MSDKIMKKQNRATARLANRVRYLPEPVLRFYEMSDGRRRWAWDNDLKSGGLLRLAVEHRYQETEPVCIALENQLPPEDGGKHEAIPSEVWDSFKKLGISVSGGKIGWNKKSRAWSWLVNLFPQAIDARAYGHSLNAPTLPNGVFHDIKVMFGKILTVNGEEAGTDGSGRYHPEHPVLKHWKGAVLQFRFINENGTFAKGILVPDNRIVDEADAPAILIDWNQVKGKNKKAALVMREKNVRQTVVGDLGLISYRDGSTTINWGFEVLENLKVCNENVEVLTRYQKRQFNELNEEGVNALLKAVSKDDENLSLIIKMCQAVKAFNPDFNPMQIKRLRSACEDKLSRTLYHLATGAGISSKNLTAVIDNAVPKGCCVVKGVRPGSFVGCFRYPVVLAQGLGVLKAIEPLDHHWIKTEEGVNVVQGAIFMNSADLIDRMQGDDDGDMIAVETRPDLVNVLLRSNWDRKTRLIEPEGKKFELATNSEQGLDYLRKKLRQNVGIFTLTRSKLLAAGDHDGARAVSILIQEDVDSAKRAPEWSNYELAADPANWHEVDGKLHFNKRMNPNQYRNGEFPLLKLLGWAKKRLAAAGVPSHVDENGVTVIDISVLAWRQVDPTTGRRSNRITPSCWHPVSDTGWSGGNLVHVMHDQAYHQWKHVEANFNMGGESIELENMLQSMLAQKGIVIQPEAVNSYVDKNGKRVDAWTTYIKHYRGPSGLTAFGSKMQSVMSTRYDGNEEENEAQIFQNIAEAHNRLYSTLDEFVSSEAGLSKLLTIWKMETSHEKGNINHAFRAVAWPGSPILKMLEIEYPQPCWFMDPLKLNKAVDWCLNQENPFSALSQIIYKPIVEGEHPKSCRCHECLIKDEQGNGIPGHQCDHCKKLLQDTLVRKIRRNRSRAEHDYAKAIQQALNAELQEMPIPKCDEHVATDAPYSSFEAYSR